MTTSAPELFSTLTTGWADAMQRWADQSQSMWDQWGGLSAWAPPAEPRRRHRHDEERGGHRHGPEHDHEHDDEHDHHDCHDEEHRDHRRDDWRAEDCCSCGCDGCHCCVPEADVVVHARVGERRVVPFRLHNRWRREREVTLEVGPWHLCSGDGLVVEATLDQKQITLKPCEDRVVRLVIAVGAAAAEKPATDIKEVAGATGVRTIAHPDLGACASAYADVRFEGCARPQRVAVVVSPIRCQPVEVGCDCGCCC